MIDEIDRISKIKQRRNSMSVKIGKAKFGNQGQQRKYFKLKDGEQAYRILPPLGELADQGRWSVFHSVHYGYKSSDGKQKPFLTCEQKDRKTGEVQVPDAAKDRITNLKAKLEDAKKTGNKAAIEALDPLVGATGMYNLDNNHYMNVIDAQGNIGILKIRHKAKLALEAEIKALNADGVDPLSVEDGRFFVFTRTGTGRDTTFGVKVLKEKMKVEGMARPVEQEVIHVLDDQTIARLGSEAGELNKIFKSLTAEEVRQVVEASDLKTGISPVLDRLFGSKTQAAAVVEDDADADCDAVGTAEDVASAPVVATPAPAPAAAPAKAAPKLAIAPKTTAAVVNEMSQEEFLAALEAGTL
jgi:hypothetical protein